MTDEFSITQHILDAGEAALRQGRKLALVRLGFLRWVDLHREMRWSPERQESWPKIDEPLTCATACGFVKVMHDTTVDDEFLCAEIA